MNITIEDIGNGFSRVTLTDDARDPVRTHVYNTDTATCEAFMTRLEQRLTNEERSEGVEFSPTRSWHRELGGDPKVEQIDRGRARVR